MSPWLEYVFKVTSDLCGPQNKPIRSGFLGEHLGKHRRTTTNYLRDLEALGKVRKPYPTARRWCVA